MGVALGFATQPCIESTGRGIVALGQNPGYVGAPRPPMIQEPAEHGPAQPTTPIGRCGSNFVDEELGGFIGMVIGHAARERRDLPVEARNGDVQMPS